MARTSERPTCAECGSFDVSLEVSAAYWDSATRTAVAGDICDSGHWCNACDGETRLNWIKTISPELTLPEFNTILGALRWWQHMEMYNPEISSRRAPDVFDIACAGTPDSLLSEDEIDALCARINE